MSRISLCGCLGVWKDKCPPVPLRRLMDKSPLVPGSRHLLAASYGQKSTSAWVSILACWSWFMMILTHCTHACDRQVCLLEWYAPTMKLPIWKIRLWAWSILVLVATLSRLWICWFAPDTHLNGSAGEHGLTCSIASLFLSGCLVKPFTALCDCCCLCATVAGEWLSSGWPLLNDSQARLIAGALRRLTATLAPDEEPETLEMLRMVFQAETRTELLAAAQRAGINLLLSDPNGLGQALRGF